VNARSTSNGCPVDARSAWGGQMPRLRARARSSHCGPADQRRSALDAGSAINAAAMLDRNTQHRHLRLAHPLEGPGSSDVALRSRADPGAGCVRATSSERCDMVKNSRATPSGTSPTRASSQGEAVAASSLARHPPAAPRCCRSGRETHGRIRGAGQRHGVEYRVARQRSRVPSVGRDA
jgi:hypothetical protein